MPKVPFNQQNQQLNLVGGCNAIKSRDLKIGVVFDPNRPYQSNRDKLVAQAAKCGGSVLTAANADKPRIGMVPHGFPLRDHRFCLLCGQTLIDYIKNLLFGHAGVLQAADLFADKSRQAFDAPMNVSQDSHLRVCCFSGLRHTRPDEVDYFRMAYHPQSKTKPAQ